MSSTPNSSGASPAREPRGPRSTPRLRSSPGVAATAAQFLATRKNLDVLLATLAYVAYASAFLAAVAAYALTRYEDVPDPRGLVRECAHRTKAETLACLVAARVKVFERNVKRHRRKVVWWWVSVGALGLGLVLSVAAIGQTDHHDRRNSPGHALGSRTGTSPHADGGRLTSRVTSARPS
jgi:hypothetical protein